jgi:hypothetical protein
MKKYSVGRMVMIKESDILGEESLYLSIYLSIYVSVYISIYGSTVVCWTLGAFSVYDSIHTVSWIPETEDQPVARPLPTHRTTQT